MKFNNLSSTSIATLTKVFNTAFAKYYVPINFTEEGMLFRIQRGRIDLGLSVGAFENGELVAFMLSGIDEWEGQSTIYNAGTGVIPAFRGQRLVDQMYSWAVPLWQAADYTQATLEVIVENEVAIKAYERVGMKIDRKLLSLQSTQAESITKVVETEEYQLTEVELPNWRAYERLRTFAPSWDFCQSGVQAVSDSCRYFELRGNNRSANLLGYAIVNSSGQIAQAGRSEIFSGGWQVLITKLHNIYPSLKWINIDADASSLLTVLEELGWISIIDQYEMKMQM